MENHMHIDQRMIGPDHPPYVIAEMSANHNGKIENAFKIIDMAKRCGADAVKLQTYTADTITLPSRSAEFVIESGIWSGMSLHELYAVGSLPWEWHKDLFEYAKSKRISIFSTPFDLSAIDFLENLGSPAYKIASFECIDLPLIRAAASTGKPLIISTGMADQREGQSSRYSLEVW